MNYNRAQIGGGVCKEPELKYVGEKETAVLKLRLASTDPRTKITEYFNVNIWGQRGEKLSEYIKKGSQIFAEGPIRNESWEKTDGSKGYDFSINADRVEFVGKNVQAD